MDGVTPGLRLRPGDRRDLGRAPHPDRRRHRPARPLHLAAAGLRGAVATASRRSSAAASGPTDGTNGTTITSGPWNIEMMLRAVEGLPINSASSARATRPARPRSSSRSRPAPPASRSTRTGAPRRRRIRAALVGRRRHGRAGRHPHRHAQRGRLRRGHDRGVRGPDDPHVPHRRRRRRPRPGHASRSPASRTCCPARPTRRCPTASTRRPSCST